MFNAAGLPVRLSRQDRAAASGDTRVETVTNTYGQIASLETLVCQLGCLDPTARDALLDFGESCPQAWQREIEEGP